MGSAGSRNLFFIVIYHYYKFLSTSNLVIFSETAPGPRPELRRRDRVRAVNVTPVNEGGDRVKLLPHAGTAAATEMRKCIMLAKHIFVLIIYRASDLVNE